MKDVLSVVTFVMRALCFVLFLITVKPDALSAVRAPSKPRALQNSGFWCAGMP